MRIDSEFHEEQKRETLPGQYVYEVEYFDREQSGSGSGGQFDHGCFVVTEAVDAGDDKRIIEFVIDQLGLDRDKFTGWSVSPYSALRSAREIAGLSQQELADQAGIEQGRISEYETFRREPSLESLRKLADALEVSAGELI